MQRKRPARRAVVLLHIVDRGDLVWLPPIVQRSKVEAYVGEDFELIDILSDGFETPESLPAFFNRAFQMLEDDKAEVVLPLKLEGGRLLPLDPKAS
jgi:hypothetical protein